MTRAAVIVVIVLAIVAGAAAYLLATGKEEAPSAPDTQAGQAEPAEPSPAAPAAEQQHPESPPEPVPAVAAVSGEEAAEPQEPEYAEVVGTVTDAATGAPIADAVISVWQAPYRPPFEQRRGGQDTEWDWVNPEGDEGPYEAETETDEDGAFAITVRAGMPAPLRCSAEGYVDGDASVNLEPGREGRVDFQLTVGATVAGRVVDTATGQGIMSAVVSAMPDSGEGFLAGMGRMGERVQAITDEQGGYKLEGVKPGAQRISADAMDKGYTPVSAGPVKIHVEEGASLTNVDFKMEKGGVVTGVATDADGEPIEGAMISVAPGDIMKAATEAMSAGGAWLDSLMGMLGNSDAEGRFEIIGLRYDYSYRLSGSAEGFTDAGTDAFTLTRAEPVAEVDLVFTEGSMVSGKAQYADGSPAAGEQLILMPDMSRLMSGDVREPGETATDEQGNFTFSHVGEGKYTLRKADFNPMSFLNPNADGTLPVTVDGTNDVTGLTLVMKAAKAAESAGVEASDTITGKVLTSAGAPASGVNVSARSMMPSRWSSVTEDDGSFELTELPAGTYDLSVESDLGRAQMSGVGAGAQNIVLRLSAPAKVSGVVVARGGEPAGGCNVTLKSVGGSEGSNPLALAMGGMFGGGGGTKTDVNGFFEFKNVEPGEYWVQAVSPSEGAGRSAEFRVAEGVSTNQLKIELDPPISFSGTVYDGRNAPLPGATVTLVPKGESDMEDMMAQFMPAGMTKSAGSATSDNEGEFMIRSIPPGTYTVRATHPDYAVTKQEGVEVEPDRDVADFKLVMTQGGTLSGSVTKNGEPVSGTTIQAMGPGGMSMATTGAEGLFEFKRLTPGRYMVQTINMGGMFSEGLSGMQPKQRVAHIAEGETTEVHFGGEGGVEVAGVIMGLKPGNMMTQVSLRREGGPAMDEIDPADFNAALDMLEFQAGSAIANPDGTFRFDEGVVPGVYILEVLSMDMAQIEQMMLDPGTDVDMDELMEMSRTPQIREMVVVEDEPLFLELVMPAGTETEPADDGSGDAEQSEQAGQ